MKKFALGFTVIAVLALGIFFVQGVSAAEGTPPVFPMGQRGRNGNFDGEPGPLHDLTIEKIAEKTGMSVEEVAALMEERTLHEALLELGYTDEELADMMREVREEVFAQAEEDGILPEGFGEGNGPGRPGRNGKGGFGQPAVDGPLHDYMSSALAEGLGITVEQLDAYHEDGLRLLEIGEELEFTAEEVSEIMKIARQTAFDQAIEDGVIPEDAGQKRPNGRPGNNGNGRGSRDCGMFNPGN